MTALHVLVQPHAPPDAALLWAQGDRHGTARRDLLPSAGPQGWVGVVDAAALSWHRLTLPRGALASSGRHRLRAVLEGLLEDHLLDEPAQLHLALGPGAAAPTAEATPVWVCAADRAALEAALAPLESHLGPVARLAPAAAPVAGDRADAADITPLRCTQDAQGDRLLWADTQGVHLLPLTAQALHYAQARDPLHAGRPVWAEPGVAAVAERLLGRAPSVKSKAETLPDLAAQSSWDLAQGPLARSPAQLRRQALGRAWDNLRSAPAWAPLRWGLVALVAVQLLGLNAAAWQQERQLNQLRQDLNRMLTDTFPSQTVIVDAPLQMQRELANLRRSRGQLSPSDAEWLLARWAELHRSNGQPMPASQGMDYSGDGLRLRGLASSADASWAPALQSLGVRARIEGDALVLSPGVVGTTP
jgi:general secretion pathway protein L